MQGENYFLFIVTELILDQWKKNGRKNNDINVKKFMKNISIISNGVILEM